MGQSENTTRREFLKASALAGSVGAYAAMQMAPGVFAAGSDVIRVGMIGCGGRNTGAAAQALTADKGARLVAMCDIFMDRVKAARNTLRQQMGDQVVVDDDYCFAGFDGYKHVIAASDVVVIANAAKFHPLHAMTAIKAGRHVFVEKPHGIDPAGIKVMQAAARLAEEKGLCLVSGLQSRYHEGYAETIKRIHDGAIGEVIAIEENFLRAPYVVIARQPGLTELQWQCSTQYHFRWLSGDDVVQSLVHNIDRASWVMKNEVPVKCHGMGGRSSMTEPIYGDVFDHHGVKFEFVNGVPIYAFCRTTTGCYNEYSSRVLGSKGSADIMGCRITGETNWRWTGRCDPYQREHDVLFAAIRAGKPVNNGEYMTRSTLVTIMGQISCYTGREVTWEQAVASDFYYPPKPEDCRDDMEPPVTLEPDGSYPVPKPGFTKMI
ncbi:MAG TPA: Gfo/Idh/MocA family oxidoreductase [Anaerohalosphaeraceae bacterium]|nr:Gfo/Idh/MocA family oxidoreductase [Anaerohalosphaeraceae bacterium]HRT51497.1 Gfo/Idh/MocA family oxidoreductase [Anaerohalosphaeraceae bacterium]HRT87168.1 Gfo/Idh/MocA family oxidoreductase [Anaerohalosphaeraceae bacterium]